MDPNAILANTRAPAAQHGLALAVLEERDKEGFQRYLDEHRLPAARAAALMDLARPLLSGGTDPAVPSPSPTVVTMAPGSPLGPAGNQLWGSPWALILPTALFPSLGSSYDDASAINDAYTAGYLAVRLGPWAYYADTVIEVPQGGTLEGYGIDAGALATTMSQKAGANLDAIVATAGWAESTNTVPPDAIFLRRLNLVGQPSQSSGAGHGIVIQNIRARVIDCVVQSVLGDGIRVDTYGADGTTELTTDALENYIVRNSCRYYGGYGIHVNAPTQYLCTDGYILNNITDGLASSGSKSGIYMSGCSDWLIEGNHVYGTNSGSGMVLGQVYQTRVLGNTVAGAWGASTTAGTYCGIDCWNDPSYNDGSGPAICGNFVQLGTSPGNSGSTTYGIAFQCGGGSTAYGSVTGNMIQAASGVTPATAALAYGNGSSASTLVVASTGNQNYGFTTARYENANGGTLTVSAGD